MTNISVKTKPGSYVWTRNGSPDIDSIEIDVSPSGEVRISGSSASRNLLKSGFFIDIEAMDELCDQWTKQRLLQVQEEIKEEFAKPQSSQIQRTGDMFVRSSYPINLDPASMNYKHAVSLGHEKVTIKIDCQHVYWDRHKKEYMKAYPDGSIFDVVIIRKDDNGKMLGLDWQSGTYVFTQEEIVNG